MCWETGTLVVVDWTEEELEVDGRSRIKFEFGDYCKRWVAEGNAKSKSADKLLRNILGAWYSTITMKFVI